MSNAKIYFYNCGHSFMKAGEWRQKVNDYWSQLHDGHRLCFGIFAVNLAVFLMWKVPSAKPFMIKYFASNPAMKNNCLPMVLSAFSHIGRGS